ncbi:GNAT family N-acetyltransferase [Streptomyces sp. A5-4]|uniref:GNAT family N-acetyltransferase n=1 Tax=Streptomyces sp. A5-4 TaxID=3384771 RepID=UPI003DAA09AF
MSDGDLAASDQPALPVGDDALPRPWLRTDAGAVMEAYQDPAIQRWYVRRADSVQEAGEWIGQWQRSWSEETGAHRALVHAGSGTLLGRVALKSLSLADGKAEVAYWTVPAARGGGLCSRAVQALTCWALGRGGFHRIELEHSTANEASCRVAVKAGFEEEGVRRSAWLHADGRHDVHLHARLRQS